MLVKLLKISSEASFKDLRSKSPFFCKALQKQVFVSGRFYKHLVYAKQRHKNENTLRMIMIPLVVEIMQKGKLVAKRDDKFFRIEHVKNSWKLTIIVEKVQEKYILLSCFADSVNKKKDLPRRPIANGARSAQV